MCNVFSLGAHAILIFLPSLPGTMGPHENKFHLHSGSPLIVCAKGVSVCVHVVRVCVERAEKGKENFQFVLIMESRPRERESKSVRETATSSLFGS